MADTQGMPATPAQPTTPAVTPAPVQAVNYASPDSFVQVKVDGRTVDVPLKDAVRNYQFSTAAEQRLQQANAIHNANTAAIESHRRMEALATRLGVDSTLLKTNPEAAAAEMAKRIGVPAQQVNGQGSSASHEDDGTDPALRALRSELAETKATLASVNGWIEKTTNDTANARTMQEIRATLSQYPLYQEDEAVRRRAEDLVVVRHLADRSKPIAQIVGETHSEDADIETRRATKQRDRSVTTDAATRTLPPGAATPGFSVADMPKPSKEDWTKGGWRKSFDAAANAAKGAFRSVQ